MNILREAFQLISGSRRTYIILNIVYYGTIIIAMVYTIFNRSLQARLTDNVVQGFSQGLLSLVGEAYSTGRILSAVGLTFIINLTLGSFIYISLPSLIVPFSGYITFFVRAFLWGILFSPPLTNIGVKEVVIGLLIALLLLLEGQGYVLVMFGAHLQGKAFLSPFQTGAATIGQGYLKGVVAEGKIYLLVVLTLIVAAVYEALIAILILPFLV
jgi:hypothetical protein